MRISKIRSRPGIEGMAEVARLAPMPLATNMCVVAFDRDALARLHEQYLRWGIRNRDDTG